MSLSKEIIILLGESVFHPEQHMQDVHNAFTNFGWKHDANASGRHGEVYNHPKFKGDKITVHLKSVPLIGKEGSVHSAVYRKLTPTGRVTHNFTGGSLKLQTDELPNYLSDLYSGD